MGRGQNEGKGFKEKYSPEMKNRVEISTGRSGEDRQKPEEKRKERERGIERGGGGERKKWIAELSLYRGKITK